GRRRAGRRNRDGRGGVRSGGSGADGHTVVAVLGNGQRRRGRCAGAPGGGCGKPHGRAESRARRAGASAARASSVGAEPDRGGRMTAFVVTMIVVVGVNTLLWVGAGLVRLAAARLGGRPRHRGGRIPRPDEVAIVIAAHNEALVIEATIRSAARQVPVENVFVACDGCTDDTVAIARACGATALDIHPNRGKAGAIRAIVEELALADRFEVLLLLDADSQLHDDYLVSGLPAFADPEVVAVAGRATTILDPPPATVLGRILVAYRERLYLSVQYLQKFGQAARLLNAVTIVPGFASMYRTRVLADIEIDAPGLAIEDYNMTFEVHAKRLGRIAFRPDAAIALTQDPDNLRDYRQQMRRWSLGFWPPVRRHGLHAGRFWALLAISIAELVTSSVFMVLVVPIVLVSVAAAVLAASGVDA